MKKFIVMVVSVIMLISMMIPMASAASTTKVTVSVTSNSYSYSYSYSSSFSSTTTSSGSFEHLHEGCVPEADATQYLEPFFDRIKEISAPHEMHRKMIEDFINGKWDGSLGPNSSTCYLSDRTYHWGSYNSCTGDWVDDANINIDYIGSLGVIPGESYTLAVDYENGRIEEWQLGELKDYWIIQLGGEQITGVQVPLDPENSTYIGNVLTADKNGKTHFYTLMPGGWVVREF